MIIASVVHNSVRKDARVIKEAISLARAGHSVTIHGISDTSNAEEFTLPGSSVLVKLSPKAERQRQVVVASWAQIMLRRSIALTVLIFAAGAALSGVSALTAPLSTHADGTLNNIHHFSVQFLLLTNLLTLGFMQKNRIKKRLITPAIRNIRSMVARLHQQLRFQFVYWFPHSQLSIRYALRAQRVNFAQLLQPLRTSLFQQAPPDVVHLHDTVSLLLADEIKLFLRCPIVWDAHEVYEDMAGAQAIRGLLNGCVIRAQSKYIDQFITINDSIKSYYERNHRALPAAHVIMNATDRVALPNYDGRLHQAAGLPESQRIILFQGGFGAKRGLTSLVQASQAFNDNWTLVLMGWGAMEAELRTLASEHMRSSSVPNTVFLPPVPHNDLQDWSAGASLGAITYENTGLNHLYCTPNKLWEYPSARVPILATDLEELGRFVRTYEIGYLLPREFSAKDISNAVNALSDVELAESRKACENFVAHSNWSIYQDVLTDLYSDPSLLRRRVVAPDFPAASAVFAPSHPPALAHQAFS